MSLFDELQGKAKTPLLNTPQSPIDLKNNPYFQTKEMDALDSLLLNRNQAKTAAKTSPKPAPAVDQVVKFNNLLNSQPVKSRKADWLTNASSALGALDELLYSTPLGKILYYPAKHFEDETVKTKEIYEGREKTPTNIGKTTLAEIINAINLPADVFGQTAKETTNLTPARNASVSTPLGEVKAPELAFLLGSLGAPTPGGAKLKEAEEAVPFVTKIAETNPVEKVINLLKEAKPLRVSQTELIAEDRSQKLARMIKVGEKTSGEAGFYAKLGQLKGAAPKVDFEPIRGSLDQSDVDNLFDVIKGNPKLSEWEKINASQGLVKLFDKKGGSIPTEGELKLLTDSFGQEFTDAILSNRSLWQKTLNTAGQALNIPRSLSTTLDLSAPFRQGVFLVGRPKKFGSAFVSMLKSAVSEKAYQGVIDEIASRPTYNLMKEHKLALTDLAASMSNREEAIMSSMVEKIPLVRNSNRAYTTFLTKLRADVFDDFVRMGEKLGLADDPKFLKSAADYTNTATGRGNIGAFEKAAPILNGLFFSPRLLYSRLSLLNPVYYAKLQLQVRQQALKDLFVFAGAAATTLGLAKLAGSDVGTDPRSADFGKIKIGNTRLDIFGGFQQDIVAATRLLTGETVSSTTGQLNFLGQGYKAQTRNDIIGNFLKNKLAPVPSFVTTLLSGKGSDGQPLDIKSELGQKLIPMFLQDLYEVYKEDPKSLPAAIPAFFGVGVQSYSASDKTAFGLEEKLSKLSPDEAAKQLAQVRKDNPTLYGNLNRLRAQKKAGITQREEALSNYGVENGERAREISKLLYGKSQAKQDQIIKHLMEGRIITKDVADQLDELEKQNKYSQPDFNIFQMLGIK